MLDPACGSGAFPMGILHNIFDVKMKINEYFMSKNHEKVKNRYELKKEIILNSIYGIDIQEIAIEISKLRIFLSLIIDENVVDEKPNRNILPLPNLEFKFVCANSLNNLQKSDNIEGDNLFEETDPIKKLKTLRDKYFNSTGDDKEELKNDFVRIQDAIKKSKTFYQYNKIEDKKIADWNPFNDEPAGWFDAEWMFGVKNGFDIITGNPPYSGISQNKGEWITKLIEDYKYINGEHFGERKHWLQDDYVKFIRMAENMIEQKGEGILAYINNHSFLDNPTFRGMRWHLLKTFDDIYIIDLHGNSKKKEVCPDGGKDENIFDIMAGVSINIFNKKSIKKTDKLAIVKHFDIFGLRTYKFKYIENSSLLSVLFKELNYEKQFYFFVEKDFSSNDEYEKGIKIDDLFPLNNTGIVTGIDRLSIFQTEKELIETTEKILNSKDPYSEFDIKDTRRTTKEGRLIDLNDAVTRGIVSISYRPFDINYMYLPYKNEHWINSPRIEVMQHFLKGSNIGLVAARQCADDWKYVFVSKFIGEFNLTGTAGRYGSGSYFPLYLYEGNQRNPNLNTAIIKKIETSLGLKFVNEQSQDREAFAPIDILDYIYAVLHSPKYREKYKEFLKIDFPRVPYPTDKETFWKLVSFGREIRQIHLLEHPVVNKPITTFPVNGNNSVEKITYENGKVFINKSQFFDKVPLVAWEFYIGGYQPAQKWLKDRKGRILTDEDIIHYQKIIVALTETDRIMKEIE